MACLTGGKSQLLTAVNTPLHVAGKHGMMRGRTQPGREIRSVGVVNNGDCVAIFHSIHRVMKAEKVLKREKQQILLIPVPRQLTSDCGLAIRYAEGLRAKVEAVLEQADLPPAEIWIKQAGEFRQL